MNTTKGLIERKIVAMEIIALADVLSAHAGACDMAPLPISVAHSEGGVSALRELSIRLLGRVPDGFPGEEYLQKKSSRPNDMEDCVC